MVSEHICGPDCPLCAGAIPAGLKTECNAALQTIIDELDAQGVPNTPDVIVELSQRRNPELWDRVFAVLADWE